MAKDKKTKLFAYEAFMEQARKEGRVRNEELSMKVLKPDLSLQARVNHIDKDHVRALHEILKNGQPLAPIIVFELPDGEFKIADGFHRHEVYKREDLPGIPCTVITGSLQEAIEYAASCNQKLSLGRNRDDIKKAVFMLMENGWFDKSDLYVSKHVGTSGQSVSKYRVEYCREKGIPAPLNRRRSRDDIELTFVRKKDSSGATRNFYRTRIGRKYVELGKDKAKAEAKFEKMREDRERSLLAFRTERELAKKAAGSGMLLLPLEDGSGGGVLNFVSGLRTTSCAIAVLKSWDANSILLASAKTLFIAEHFKLQKRVVVAYEIHSSFNGLIELAKGIGVEFWTVREFFDRRHEIDMDCTAEFY